MARWRFRTPWWAPLLVAALSALMIWLGCWQLGRGEAKQALLDRYALAEREPPGALDARQAPRAGQIARVRVSGHYDTGRQLLLDNQGHDGKPGYHVWTPLQLADGGVLLVDRGWIERGQAAAVSAPGGGEVELLGYWRALPQPGLRLAVDNCAAGDWPRVVQFPTVDDLRCIFAAPVAPGLLLLDAAQPDGYVRQWQTAPELQPAKHYGYAAQWFAFTATLVAIFLRLSFRRHP